LSDIRSRALRVDMLAHAYLEPEVRKNVVELAKRVDIQVIAPTHADNLVFRRLRFGGDDQGRALYRLFRPLYLFGAQYVLLSVSLGLRGRRPCVLHIDYDPWAVVFWQAVLCRALFSRGSRIVCGVKKNTYRAYPGLRGQLKRRVARAGARRVDRFMAASQMAQQMYVREFGISRCRLDVVTHMGVDTEVFSPAGVALGGQELICGYTGRLHAMKGVLELVDSVERCRRGGLALRLRLLGAGPLAAELQERAAAVDWLDVLPPVPNAEVAVFLRTLDIFVLPSRVLDDHQEHDAHALLEALASGLPAIGTSSGIIPEILGDGTGLVIEPEDVAALSRAFRMLVEDSDLRAKLRRRGRAKAVREYALQEVAQRKIDVYRRAANE
jgi:glycosyltransferase involved in cell wall biosynthesis